MKHGDSVKLDLGFNNYEIVRIIKITDEFSSITNGQDSWFVRTNRLSEIKNEHLSEFVTK